MEAFDIFVRNYEDGKPMITLTVNPAITIAKLKRQFAEQCNNDINTHTTILNPHFRLRGVLS